MTWVCVSQVSTLSKLGNQLIRGFFGFLISEDSNESMIIA